MKHTSIFKTLALALFTATLAACSEDLSKADYDKAQTAVALPTVTTGAVDCYGVAAEVNFSVVAAEGTTVTEQGVIVNKKSGATLTDADNTIVYVSNLKADGSAVASLSGLTLGETYYVKPFAYVGEGNIAYGEEKSFLANGDDYAYEEDLAIDFNDVEGADISKFTTVKLGDTVNPFTAQYLDILQGYIPGATTWGFVSTVFDPDMLFSQGQGSIVSYDENNLLTYKADLTGYKFAQVSVTGVNICSLFGADYAALSGNFDVLVSAAPITTAAELAAAEVIGTCTFPTDTSDDEYLTKTITCDIPGDYDGTCYITIHNNATYTSSGGNFGVIIDGFSLSSLHKKTAE